MVRRRSGGAWHEQVGEGAGQGAASATAGEPGCRRLTVATAFGFCRLFVGWSFLAAAAAGRGRLATCSAAAAGAAGWNVVLRPRRVGRRPGRVRHAGLLPQHQLLRPAHDGHLGRHARPTSSWPGTQFATAMAPVPADTGYVVAAVIGVWARRLPRRRLRLSCPRRPSRRSCRRASSSCSLRRWAPTDYRLAARRPVAGAAAAGLRPAPHRCAQDGGGWLGGIRRGPVGVASRASPRISASPSSCWRWWSGPPCRAPATRRCSTPARSVRLAPDAEPAGRHPGPHRQPERPRAVHRRRRQPAYWRLTALDEFDGRIWTVRRAATATPTASSAAASRSSSTVPARPGRSRSQALDADLAAGRLRARAASPSPTASATTTRRPACVIRRTTLPPGHAPTVSFRGARARRRPSLQAGRGAAARRHPDALPRAAANFPDTFRQLAAQITASGTTPYEKALALQNWFQQNFTYDLDGPPGPRRPTPSTTSSSQRRGYCEQFAGTFAAFARSLGIPARVGRRVHAGRARQRRALPRARQARPRLARGVLHRRRLGALRAHPEPRRSPAPRPTPACPPPRRQAPQAPATTVARGNHPARLRATHRCPDGDLTPGSCRPRPSAAAGLPGELDQQQRDWPLRIVSLVLAGARGARRPVAPARAPHHPRPAGTGGGGAAQSGRAGAASVAGGRPTAWPAGRRPGAGQRDAPRVRRPRSPDDP